MHTKKRNFLRLYVTAYHQDQTILMPSNRQNFKLQAKLKYIYVDKQPVTS